MNNTFMVIDDDVNIRKMINMIIKKNNLGVVIGELDSGEHAVEEIMFYNPDIILIDFLLPINDGIEVIRETKKKGYTGRFIMISQVEEENMISEAYENGILFFIDKPINSIEVVNVIRGVERSIELEKSLELIKNAVVNINTVRDETSKVTVEDQINKIFTDIGILGMAGSSDLKKVLYKIIDIKKRNSYGTYHLQEIYDEIVEGDMGDDTAGINIKTLEQRIRRVVQKALQTMAELGSEDYSNSIFIDYSTSLFDFKQIRQEMRHIENPKEDQGKINIKKFIEGIVSMIKC